MDAIKLAKHYRFTIKMKPRRILHEKTQGFLRGWRGWHINLQSRWRPGAFYMRKRKDFSGVGGGWHLNLQSRWRPGAFYTRKHKDFSGVGGGWHINLQSRKARRILHEKTQRFLRGRWRTEEGVYINKEQRWNDIVELAQMFDVT